MIPEKKIPNRHKAQQSIQTRDYSLRPQNLRGRVLPRSASCQKSKETPAKHNQSDLSALSLEQIESLLTDHEQGAANSARFVHAFVHEIQPYDRVFANAGKSSCKRFIDLSGQEANNLKTRASVRFLCQRRRLPCVHRGNHSGPE